MPTPTSSPFPFKSKKRNAKHLKAAVRHHLRNRSTIKLVRLNELILSQNFVTFKPLPETYFPNDLVRKNARAAKVLKLDLLKRGKKRSSRWGMGNELPNEGSSSLCQPVNSNASLPTSISQLLDEVNETGLFILKSDSLHTVRNKLKDKYKHGHGSNLYYTFGPQFQFDPAKKNTTHDGAHPVGNVQLIDTDAKFDRAMESWQVSER